jgi:hypothetical protein
MVDLHSLQAYLDRAANKNQQDKRYGPRESDGRRKGTRQGGVYVIRHIIMNEPPTWTVDGSPRGVSISYRAAWYWENILKGK